MSAGTTSSKIIQISILNQNISGTSIVVRTRNSGSDSLFNRGFTLVEVLVVIAIIGVLVGMLLPAVQNVRESARRTTCLNQMKQLGLAIQMFEDTSNAYPPTRPADGFLAWPVFAMPYIEQNNLYDQMQVDRLYADQDPAVVATPMEVMFCPSRRSPEISNFETNGYPVGGCGDYAGNGGTSEFFPYDIWADFSTPNDGVLVSGLASENPVAGNRLVRSVKGRFGHAGITDGTTNTFLLGEKAVNLRNLRHPGGWGDGSMYNGNEPGTLARLGGYALSIAKNERFGAPGPGAIPVYGSAHRQVCNFAMCDASVHSIKSSIDDETLRRLCARNDGETVSLVE